MAVRKMWSRRIQVICSEAITGESEVVTYVTLYAKRDHFAQKLNFELLVSADSTHCAL